MLKRKYIKISSLLLSLILIIPIIKPNLIKADIDQGINLSPTNVDIKLKTDQQYTGSFTLTNNENTDLNLEFKESEKDGDQVAKIHNLEWFNINNSESILRAESKLTINYTIKIPTDQKSGFISKLLVANLYSEETNQTNFNINIPFTTNIVIESLLSSSSGTVIKDFSTNNKLVFDNKVNLNLTLNNSSDTNISKPISHINIISPSGQIVYTNVLNETLNILTKEEAYTLMADIPSNLFKDIGQYTAQVIVTDALTNKSDVKKITFVVFNQIYILLIIGIVLVVSILLRFLNGLFKVTSSNTDDENESYLGIKKITRKRKSK